MILEILLFAVLGIIFGIICGLLPGIHTNLVSIILFSVSLKLQDTFFISSISLGVFIVSMSITQNFIDFIPGIFLGAPEETTALSILPGHKLLLKGMGYAAVKLSVIGCLFGALVAIAFAPLLLLFLPKFYAILSPLIPLILILLALFLILTEEKIVYSIFIFFLSGILGFILLNFPLVNEPLLPLFSGLFGTSLLFSSIFEKVKIPPQKIISIKMNKKEINSNLIKALISSLLVSFFPGIGSSQAATISSFFKKNSNQSFLFLVGAINMMVMIFSFVALYSINKPRTGSAVIIGKLFPSFEFKTLLICLAVCLFASGISFILSLLFARIFSKIITKVNYPLLCILIILFIFIICFFISGWISILILIISSAIGILCSELGIKKINLMGCLILPVIIYYFI